MGSETPYTYGIVTVAHSFCSSVASSSEELEVCVCVCVLLSVG